MTNKQNERKKYPRIEMVAVHNFLVLVSMQESILNIKLSNRLTKRNCNGQDSPTSNWFDNRAKYPLIADPFL